MSAFAVRHPYFIVVVCLVLMLDRRHQLGAHAGRSVSRRSICRRSWWRRSIQGMPPEDIESDITDPFERFFTLASGIDHMESRSLPGVSIIKVYFQPGTNADADMTELSNLALADLKRLPPGTLPPVVLKFDASSLPVCLVTLKGAGTQRDATARSRPVRRSATRSRWCKGAEIPPPFGGKYRQVMVYVDPYKLLSRSLSVMDVVDAVNKNNLILPAGDVKVGPYDYYVYSNALVDKVEDAERRSHQNSGAALGFCARRRRGARTRNQIQYNLVRVDGQRSTYLPIMKQGGETNTIQVVDGIRAMLGKLFGVPKNLVASAVFDQSAYVKEAIKTLMHEGLIGLLLTSLMILIFLASLRATFAVFLSIPLSGLTTFIVLYLLGGTVNTMVLGGLALAFSRIIDNSVISLENIYRHLEEGATPERAAEDGGSEVSLAVLAATLTAVVVFFPVTFLYGVSKFLFTALAMAVVISLFVSYFVAMTVIPLFCARYLHKPEAQSSQKGGLGERFHAGFNRGFTHLLDYYERTVRRAVRRPILTVALLLGLFAASLALYPLLGVAFFPRTDAGQFSINLKAPTGTRIEVTEQYVARVEDLIHKAVRPSDFHMIVSTVGLDPGFASLYTTNAGEYTATVQTALKTSHAVSSFEYMDRIRRQIAAQYPELAYVFHQRIHGGCRSQSWACRRLSTSRFPAPICIPPTMSRAIWPNASAASRE